MKTTLIPIPTKKSSAGLVSALAILALVASGATSQAADGIKADNLNNLNLGTSWTNGVAPTVADVAVWDATVATAVPQTLALGAATSWGGIRIVDPAGAVTLGLNAVAITATASSATLTYTVAPANPFVNDDRVALGGTTAPGGFTLGTVYFVVNATATTFQLSAISGGAAIVATTTGTAVNATGGSVLTLGASGIDTSGGSQFLTLAGPVVAGAAQSWNLVSGVTINGGLSGAAASGNDVTLNSGTLTIGGRGMTLSNLVVNSGATVSISAGGLGIVALNGGTFSVNGAIGQGLLVTAGGGTVQNTGGNRTWSGILSGSGPLTVNCSGSGSTIFTWSGNNTNYTGTITKQGAGSLRLSSVNSVGAAAAYIITSGTMTANAAGLFNLGSLAGSGGGVFGGAGQNYSIGALNADTDFGGTVGGATMIIKIGTGTQIFSGDATNSGSTVISNGVLQIGNGTTTGTLGTGSVTNESRLVFNRDGTVIVTSGITGSGSVTNVGPGRVALTGTNSYTGPTTITAGTLAFGTASRATGNITVGNIATIGAVLTSAGGTVTNGNVSFGSGCSYEFDLGTFGNPPGTVATNTGTVTFTGNNVTVNVLGTNFISGTITLLRYANRAGAGSFVLGSLPPGVNLVSFTDDTVNKRVLLAITVGAPPVDTTFRWISDPAGVWDIDNLANQIWRVVGTGQTTNYTEGAAVLFDDTATGTTTIDLITFVNPSAITVNNTNKTYTLGGIGSVSGPTGLTKKGTGALVVTNANSYSGVTAIESGSLRIAGETGAIGSGGVTNNGALIIDRTEATNTLPNTFIFSGQITGTGGLTIRGVDSTNSIIQVDVGTANGNPYSGGTTISNAYVNLVANPISDATRSAAKATGLGSGQITFLGDSLLELEDYGVGNSSGQAGNFAAPLNIPAGQMGALRTAGRATVSSTLTGSGTFNLAVSYIRNVISGDFSAFTGQLNVTPSPNTTGNQYQVANAAGLPSARVHLAAGVTMGGHDPLLNNSIVPIGELSGDIDSFVDNVGATPRTAIFTVGGLNTSSTFAGNIGGTHSWVKVGAGTFTLSGTNDYTGSTTVSNGVLALVGEAYSTNSVSFRVAAPGILDISGLAGGTLSVGSVAQSVVGNGTIRGSLVVGSLGTVSPGFSIGTLAVTNTVTLGGVAVMELNRAAVPNSDKITSLAITAGGTLMVTNIGVALQVGDTFQLFSTPVTGSFGAISLPTTDTVNNMIYTWNNKLTIDGTIVVLTAVPSVNTTPTNITFTATGNTLDLQWPADHTGWTLQTNSVGVAVANAWFAYPGSTTTNRVFLTIDPSKANVFYRLVYP